MIASNRISSRTDSQARRRRRSVGAAAVVLALVAAACGGDDDDAADTPAADTAPDESPAESTTPEPDTSEAPPATDDASEPATPTTEAAAEPFTVPDGTPELKLGVAPSLSAAPGIYALEQGYFAEYGLDVSLSTDAAVSSQALPLLATGDYTVLAATWSAAVLNALQDGDVISVLGDTVSLPEEGLGSSQILMSTSFAEEGHTSAAAFEGQRVGVLGLAGLAEFEMQQAITAAGVDMSTVELVVLGRPDIQAALENNSVVGAWCSEPLCTSLVSSGSAVSLGNEAGAGQDIFVLYSNSDYQEAHPEAMVAFMAAWTRAAIELNEGAYDDPAVQEMLSEYTGIPAEVIATVPAPLFVAEPDRIAPDPEYVEAHESYYRSLDVLTYDESLDVLSRYNPDIVDQAVAILGS